MASRPVGPAGSVGGRAGCPVCLRTLGASVGVDAMVFSFGEIAALDPSSRISLLARIRHSTARLGQWPSGRLLLRNLGAPSGAGTKRRVGVPILGTQNALGFDGATIASIEESGTANPLGNDTRGAIGGVESSEKPTMALVADLTFARPRRTREPREPAEWPTPTRQVPHPARPRPPLSAPSSVRPECIVHLPSAELDR